MTDNRKSGMKQMRKIKRRVDDERGKKEERRKYAKGAGEMRKLRK